MHHRTKKMAPKLRAQGLQNHTVSGVRRPMASLNPQIAPAPPNTSRTSRAENIWRRRMIGFEMGMDDDMDGINIGMALF